jgi:glycosyltransferase involved in cell wall biosynthesis
MTGRPLRVCLDARLKDGDAGGVQQFVMGLASGLSALPDGDEEYLFLSFPDQRTWLAPHLFGPCRAVDAVAPRPRTPPLPTRILRAPRGLAATLGARYLARSRLGGLVPIVVPESDGTVEESGAEVMHFTLQGGFRTALPSIYQPYDLQHVHLPQFFTPYVRHARDVVYRDLSRAARAVVVMSSWVKDDIVRHLSLRAQDVYVIPWAPVTDEYPRPSAADVADVKRRLSLPDEFAIYPAQTFPHKNHLALVDAVDAARRRGHDVRVVCPGKKSDHFERIARRIGELGLERDVVFPGYVTPLELQCLYRLARFLVFPSLFEGGGMPIFEAYATGLAVACSNVTCIPRQAGGTAVFFDPRDREAIADAMIRLWGDREFRADLARRGAQRVSRFTWERTARTYRALYRKIAGRSLADEDRALLEAEPDT